MLANNVSRSTNSRYSYALGRRFAPGINDSNVRRHTYPCIHVSNKIARPQGHSIDAGGPARNVVHARRQAETTSKLLIGCLHVLDNTSLQAFYYT